MRISDWSSDVCSSDLGFIGKLALFRATIEAGYAWLAVVAVANTVASLFYYLRVVGPMYLRPAEVRAVSLGHWTTTATWVGPVAVIGIGLLAEAGLADRKSTRLNSSH